LSYKCVGTLNFDGYLNIKIKVSASAGLPISDLRLTTELTEDASVYSMGFGCPGGLRKPINFHWNSPETSFWVGGTHAGLWTKFVNDIDRGPNGGDPPRSWKNDGKGSVGVTGESRASLHLAASTGPFRIGSEGTEF
jgi:hypothetical protein